MTRIYSNYCYMRNEEPRNRLVPINFAVCKGRALTSLTSRRRLNIFERPEGLRLHYN